MNYLTIASLLASTATAKIFFQDTFDDANWQSRWNVPSKNTAELGAWEVSSGKFFADEQKNQGLRTVDNMRFYALTAPFAEPVSNAGRDLIVQFSAKNEQNLNCGGAYVKVTLLGAMKILFSSFSCSRLKLTLIASAVRLPMKSCSAPMCAVPIVAFI